MKISPLKLAAGFAIVVAVVVMRGLVPELYRYIRIRRM